MKVIFLLRKGVWFIEHSDAWYRISDKDQIGLALSGLALRLVDEHELVEQPHQAGTAAVSQPDSQSLNVALSTPANIPIESMSVVLDERSLMDVNWITARFRDGWLSADARVMLDNVNSLYVEAYLPAKEGSSGKTLNITDTRTGHCREVWLERDRKTRIPVMERGKKGKVHLTLSCEPERVDQSSEPRQLGFVMVSEESHPAV